MAQTRDERRAQTTAWIAANKELVAARKHVWAEANKEHVAAYKKAWKAANKERIAAKNRAEYLANCEEIKARSRAYNAAHPEEKKQRDQAYYATHKEEYLLKSKDWVQENPEARRAIRQRYYATHQDEYQASNARRRARQKAAPRSDFTTDQWLEMQAAYGHRCVYCQKRCKGRLTMDHLTPLVAGGAHTASNIVPACRSCNGKKWANGVLCPVQPLLLTLA